MECKKTITRLGFSTFIVVVIVSLLQACATTEAVLGQDSEKAGYNMAKELRGNVVYVTGTVDKKPEYGLGFIVGEKNKELFIVTANHVVRPMDPGPGQPIPESAQVEFLHAQGEYKKAQIIRPRDEKVDLAILSVPSPENFEWQKMAIGQPDLEPSDKVWTIDHDMSWTPSAVPGSISKSDPMQITTSGLKVLRGHSGAPLISKSGIIGMIYKAEPYEDSIAYPLEVVKSRVEEWGKPWDLENNYTEKKTWLWVLLGVTAAILAVVAGGDDSGDGGAGDTGTLTVTAPVP